MEMGLMVDECDLGCVGGCETALTLRDGGAGARERGIARGDSERTRVCEWAEGSWGVEYVLWVDAMGKQPCWDVGIDRRST